MGFIGNFRSLPGLNLCDLYLPENKLTGPVYTDQAFGMLEEYVVVNV